ncbi:16S rRNA (cytosine(1402)-N(4))-methyltransferase RsmH [Desulfofundulus thermocisternus]|uniref:16S rRNA (cytosine(1402)-N(4))-methyltransferase RsmH n=1 Tax=Desulfofundulus thermocisternus TaxID=42471 RepID=UPI0019E3FD29|nr:16S rRNA (cytosine(1402)-N(4))-methyltransferase RsmH [Desulfofundulus thermocisternus]MBE3584896.1 16S rRNA (cytosine(1402)-N(4))-methyltransferase RsmH [Thermoanaerobacter sp.]MCS5694660.1 16S rRNA (cytosine(1402)-N(4))-methyltransferase RsmH [Desulfofundulus thermocisternus]
MENRNFVHQPVMLEEVVAWLNPQDGGTYVDCTVGGGGHAAAILEKSGPGSRLIGLDQDPLALEAAARRLAPYGERVTLVKENFVNLARVLDELGVAAVNGVLFDLGVSSPQVDVPERGFSYHHDGPLDMRMDPSSPCTAADLINKLPEEELAGIIARYGEERWARRIASFIVQKRRQEPVTSTLQLVEIIKEAIPARYRRSGPHPARRTFQALRIAVNRELEVLPGALDQAVDLLASGGRILVITFHSLEDRIVKNLFRRRANPCTCPPGFPQCTCGQKPALRVLVPGGITPSPEEIEANPRSRSARLRVAEKLQVF